MHPVRVGWRRELKRERLVGWDIPPLGTPVTPKMDVKESRIIQSRWALLCQWCAVDFPTRVPVGPMERFYGFSRRGGGPMVCSQTKQHMMLLPRGKVPFYV
jgi:hypothetical protein